MVLDTATRPPLLRQTTWSTSVDIDLDVDADVAVEQHLVSTAEREATALSVLVAARPDRQAVVRLGRAVRYIQPTLVLVAAFVWLHVLTVTAHALM